MGTRYLYFNKTAFKRLIKLWRRLNCDNNNGLAGKSDEWLIEHYIPLKFIEDIENTIIRGRR